MVYVGFGIVAASLSFLIYKHGFATLSRLLPSWKGNHDARQERFESSQTSKQGPQRVDGVKAEKEVLIQQERAESDDDSKPNRADFGLEEPTMRNSTPIPSFTLDSAESSDAIFTSGSGEPLSSNDSDLISKMALELTLPPEQAAQEPSISMPPPPRPSQPLRPPQASASGLMTPPSRPSPYSSTLRPLARPSNTSQPPPSAAAIHTSSRLPQASASALMPPPSRPSPNSSTSTLKPLPKTSSRLQPPPSAAASLRVPPSRSPAALSPSSLAASASTSTLAPSKRPSKKVLLDPGHSPLDWAYLTQNPPTPTYLRGDSAPPNLIRIPPSLLRHQNGRKGKEAWGVWQGKVYNLTPYMKFHPGGVDELMKAAGREKDGERLFLEVHPWVSWESMLSECLVGILVGEGEDDKGGTVGVSSLEEMD